MKKLIIAAIITGMAVGANAQMVTSESIQQAEFTPENEAKTPIDYRKWIFIGSPLTPNALNDGAAAFPEFHNVYVEPSAYEHFAKTGQWAEGTQIAKELALIYQNDNDELGATYEVSGHGYQQGEFNGLELLVKDNARFPEMPGGWAFFSFGHHAPPYAKTSAAFPADSCNACHADNAETDFVFTQFYPVLRSLQK